MKPANSASRARIHVELLENRDVPSLVPVGPEFQVNTGTTGIQFHAAVGMDADGDFTIVWSDWRNGPAPTDLFAQQFNAAGAPLGNEFQANTAAAHTFPAIGVAPNGDFVVAWRDESQTPLPNGMVARRFDGSGTPLGSVFPINSSPNAGQYGQSIAVDSAGDFVCVWSSYEDVFARRFDASGSPLGPEFGVNNYTTGNQANPWVAMDANGDFVVAWEGTGLGESVSGIFARRFNSDGDPIGTDFRVNTTTTGFQYNPRVGIDANGNFAIAWTSGDQDGSGVFAQRFNASGVPLGTEFQVNTYTSDSQGLSSLAMAANGDFIVSWNSGGQDGDGFGVYAQAYSPLGVAVGTEVRINSTTIGEQFRSAVALDSLGHCVIAWESLPQDGSAYGVFAQRYLFDQAPTIASTQVNSGAAQRSRVTDLAVTFDAQVTFAGPIANAFTLTRAGGGPVAFSATASVVNGVTVVTLNNFTGPETESGSLRDGRYNLTALASQISANGQQMASNYAFGDAQGLFRFYGDMNGDRRVDISDFGFFSQAFLQTPNYNAALDFNNDGRIDIADFGQFSVRFFTTLP